MSAIIFRKQPDSEAAENTLSLRTVLYDGYRRFYNCPARQVADEMQNMNLPDCQRLSHAVVETRRLALCPLKANDAVAFEAVFCSPEVMKYSLGVKSPAWVREWITNIVENLYPAWGCGLWAVVVKHSCEVIGYCGLTRFPDRCETHESELAFRLARPFWGMGYAGEAAGAALNHGLNALGFERIVAGIDPENTASVRVVKGLGMRFVREIMYDGYAYPDHLYTMTSKPSE